MKNDTNRERADYLFRQIQRGSQQAFSSFYDQYIGFVFRIALNAVQDRQEAEDICHDVFLEVFLHPERYNPERGSVEAWLAVKTRSRCLDRLRKRKAVCVDNWERVAGEQILSPSAEVLVLERAEREAIYNAMQDIPEPQRNVLYDAYFKERTHRELSERIQLPLGTIKSRIRYGLHNLKKRLTLLGWVHPERGEPK